MTTFETKKEIEEPVPRISPDTVLECLVLLRNNDITVRMNRAHLSILLNLGGIAGAATRIVLTKSKEELVVYMFGSIWAMIFNVWWSRIMKRQTDHVGC